MKKRVKVCFILTAAVVWGLVWSLPAYAAGSCTTKECHAGISTIVPDELQMMQTIKMNGQMHGDPDGCVVCHGGNPKAVKKEEAHKGIPPTLAQAPGPKDYYPDPGSIWVADYTCGPCHPGYVHRTTLSLMNTEAGKIQGNLHTWGLDEVKDYKVPWGNYDIEDKDGSVPYGTTPEYARYMTNMVQMFPKQFPASLKKLPSPTVEEIEKDPRLAGITYQRHECQRCHIGVRGREKRGDYRGMGCSACHILYSNDGYYEGEDKSINKDEPGHILKHRIAGNRKTGGIPVESCNSCHNRGKRIGVSFQGLMEFPYGSPFDAEGDIQPKLHTKRYLFISDDLHHQVDKSREGNPTGGLLCQDCHTSVDIHGDGNIHGTTMGQVEIECSDCHGTPEKYAWELPLGYGDDFGRDFSKGKPRGLADKVLLTDQQFGYPYKKQDGFLISARGNPLGNVVKSGEDVIVHSATGNDFKVPVLKNLALKQAFKDVSAQIAMASVKTHVDKMECYGCHASWVPQCYGCHVKVDYSLNKDGSKKSATDWVASGNARMKNGQTAESKLGSGGIKSPGKISEKRSYLRWEDPVLGINGEGRVSPLMPGCQISYTVIGSDGKMLVQNHIADNPGEAKAVGQDHTPLAIDMAPVQPHTAQRQARTCENCHISHKTAGLGLGNGTFGRKQNVDIVEDLIDAKTGKVIPKRYSIQIPAIPKLDFDWSQIVTREGKQLATVGTHWPMSRAFNKKELDGFLRAGTCMGCHGSMGKKDMWKKVSTEGRLDEKKHMEMMMKMLEYMAAKAKKGQDW